MKRKFNNKQQAFIKKFIDILYHSMAIEREAPYSRREFSRKFRHHAIDLIDDGTYKKVRF
ncbi:MAG: hypothetical protein A2666_02665 [Parcubacteria group bacterium RIFCSPHIGHO2_01_FULL_47_10b]|nr:MAG: hypothetical protein A2666_02665 [Parcubacteria group bacterium RIFCSPHIGHO2_01_FULL_47_10b]